MSVYYGPATAGFFTKSANCRKICGILSAIWLRSAVSVDDMVSLMPMRKSCDVETTTGVNQVDMIDTLSARPKNKKAQNLRVNFEVSIFNKSMSGIRISQWNPHGLFVHVLVEDLLLLFTI